jgi:hypothetical protein
LAIKIQGELVIWHRLNQDLQVSVSLRNSVVMIITKHNLFHQGISMNQSEVKR